MAPITENTTRSDPPLLPATLVGLMGLGLMIAGALGLFVPLSPVTIQETVARAKAGLPTDAVLRQIIGDAVRHSLDGAVMANAGVMAMADAQSAGLESLEGKLALQRARNDFRIALARAPAHGEAWVRMSAAIYLLEGPSPDAAASLSMSLQTSRLSGATIPLQIALIEATGARQSPEGRALSQQFLKRLWSDPTTRSYLNPLLGLPSGLQIMRDALADQPVALAAFEAWFRDQPQTNPAR